MLVGGRLIDDRHEYLESREFGGVIFVVVEVWQVTDMFERIETTKFLDCIFGDCFMNDEIRILNIPWSRH